MRCNILIAVALIPVVLGGAYAQNAKMNTQQTKPMEQGKETIVDLETTMGPIKIKLYDDTPQHRDNFVKLVKEGFYDGVLFHRVINDFMVQTGDPDSKEAQPGQMLGGGDPGYTLPAEIIYPKHYHKYGALAAARTGDNVNPERRSSSSQFYIVTGRKASQMELDRMAERAVVGERQELFRKLFEQNKDSIKAMGDRGDREAMMELRQQMIDSVEKSVPARPLPQEMAQDYLTLGGTPHLDNQYTVFGEVVSGMETVEKYRRLRPTAMTVRKRMCASSRLPLRNNQAINAYIAPCDMNK